MRITYLLGLALSCALTAQDFETTTALFGDLQARQIGPATMSGRVSCLAVDPTDANTVYIGAGGGGIWRTTNGGADVQPVFDDYSQSIGALAVAPSAPKTLYAGTGEAWTRNSVSVGTGMYKSTDGGNRWSPIGLDSTERIAAIAVHPEDANVVYVAALGPLWSDGSQRGVFKTTDGGQHWERILYLNEHTGAASLSMDPNDPERLFVAMWSHRRYPYSFDSGYKGTSGLYRTTDGGANWTLLDGLPDETLGRIGVAIAPSKPDVVYASVETGTKETKGFYRSTDGGDSWELIDRSANNQVRPFYFAHLIVDPSNDSIVLKPGWIPTITENAGTTWRTLDRSIHADLHTAWFDPNNGKHILVGTDGGVYESFDRGSSFRMWNNLPLSQFYHVSVDLADPYHVYGGMQDNGSWYAPSSSPGGIENHDWTSTFGGDGFYSFRHPTKPHLVFSEAQGGMLYRWDERTGRANSIKPYADADTDPLRFNWNAPIHLSADGERLYFASQYLYRSTNEGDGWERISPDLTTNDTAYQKQYESGGLSIDNSTAENYTTIYAVAESPLDQQLIWVGTDDGNLQLTRDGGNTWNLVLPSGADFPTGAWVTFVESSPHDPASALVTFDAHRTGDQTTYLYRTDDYGQSWTRLVDEDFSGYALSVRQDLENPNLLFLGTEFGLYISLDGGMTWAPFRNNVPQVGIRDMVIHPREGDLVLGTHGRGVIILDDLEALRQLTPDLMGNKITFLTSDTTYFYDGGGAGGNITSGRGYYTGSNPSNDARIMYYADKRHTFGKMYVEIYQDTQLIRTLQAGKSAGLNVLTLPITTEAPKAPPSDNSQATFSSLMGPPLAAGTYDVRLIKGRDTFATRLVLAPHPESIYPAAARAAQRALATQLYDATEEVAYLHEVLDRVASRADSLGLSELADRANRQKAELVYRGGDGYVNTGEQLGELVTQLYGDVARYPGRPSASQVAEAGRLRGLIDTARTEMNGLLQVVDRHNQQAGSGEQITYPSKQMFLAK